MDAFLDFSRLVASNAASWGWAVLVLASVLMLAHHFVALPYQLHRETGGLPTKPFWKIVPFFGEAVPLSRNSMNYLDSHYKMYGGSFCTLLMGKKTIVISGKELLEQVFNSPEAKTKYISKWPSHIKRIIGDSVVTKDGLAHHKERYAVLKLFGPASVGEWFPVLVQMFKFELDQVAHDTSNGAFVDLIPHLKRAVAKTMYRALLGEGFEERYDIEKITRAADDFGAAVLNIPINFPGTKFRKGLDAAAWMKELARNEIKVRFANPEKFKDHNDALQILIKHSLENNEPVNVDTFVLLFYLSFDTTLSMAILGLIELFNQPQVTARLREEALATFGSLGLAAQNVSWREVATKMPYTMATVKECMRFTAMFPFMPREVIKPITINVSGSNFTIPAGYNILVAVHPTIKYNTHYVDGDLFQPERFLPPRKEDITDPSKQGFPMFGVDHHGCPGQVLARAELAIVISLMSMYEWKAKPVAKYNYAPFKTPANGLYVQAKAPAMVSGEAIAC